MPPFDHAAAATFEGCSDDSLTSGLDNPLGNYKPDKMGPKRPSVSRDARIPALIQDLLNWIETNTVYDVSVSRKQPPSVHFCKTGDSISYEGRKLIVDERLAAVYDLETRTINIAEPWSPDNLRDVSKLLHELIHDVQTRHRKWTCWGDAEWTTYKLQRKWLLARGVKPDFNWIQIFLITRCPRDIHP